MIELLNVDCNTYMKNVDDKYFDLAIVDPPYGIGVDNERNGNFVMTKHEHKNWDHSAPDSEYFNQLFRISKKQIIWGGNYFSLPAKKGWICWDKVNPLVGKFSDFELAWTSFLNCDRIYRQEWIGFGRNFKEKHNASIHPTQKPIQLYSWILKSFALPGEKIFDSHSGSGSIAIACHDRSFDLVACEIEAEYFNDAQRRYFQHTSQLSFLEKMT